MSPLRRVQPPTFAATLRRMRAWILSLGGVVLAGCGGPPSYPYVMEAPAKVGRWEPSGAAVRGDLLWVVNDREGYLAAYQLPLTPGVNTVQRAFVVLPHEGRVKWEAIAPSGDAGLLLLEAISRTVWRCADPADGCAALERVPIDNANAVVDDAVPRPPEYITFEGLAAQGERVLLGVRGYLPEAGGDEDFRAWSFVLDPTGRHVYDGAAWQHEGRAYGISGLALDGTTLWMTWSYELDSDATIDGVAGLLARAEIDRETGLPGTPRLCRALAGKPEGVAVWGSEHLVVVFDNDLRRKDPTREDAFPVAGNQDFATVVRKADCPADAPQMPRPRSGR